MVLLSDYNDYEVEVDLDDLSPLNGVATTEPRSIGVKQLDPVPARLAPTTIGGEADARRSVEALRFGLVPDRHIAELTLGMEALDAWTTARLPSAHEGRPLASAITGPFGTGKSHTMSVVRHIARREDYVVARVEVDGQAVSLSSPPKLLNRLWSTLGGTGLESFTPVLDLYLKAIDAGKPAPTIAPSGIDRIRHNYEVVSLLRRAGHIDKHGPTMDDLLTSSEAMTAIQATRVFTAEPNVSFNPYGPDQFSYSPKAMIGRRVEERPYDFVEVLAGHATVAKLAGFRGLVLTIDEFEVEVKHMTAKSNKRVNDLLGLLAEYFAGNLDYQVAPLALFFATVGGSGHEGDRAITRMLGAGRDVYHELSPWSSAQRAQLAERLHQLYSRAYKVNSAFDPAQVAQVERQLDRSGHDSGQIRAFIKRYVAALDSSLGPRAA